VAKKYCTCSDCSFTITASLSDDDDDDDNDDILADLLSSDDDQLVTNKPKLKLVSKPAATEKGMKLL